MITQAHQGYKWLTRNLDDPVRIRVEYENLFPEYQQKHIRGALETGCGRNQCGEPIIAWNLGTDKSGKLMTTPITIRGEVFDRPGWLSGILFPEPDDRVYIIGFGMVSSLLDYFDSALARAERGSYAQDSEAA